MIHFQGSGTKIISKSCQIVIGDEVDTWSMEHPQNIRDLLKRTRSYTSSMAFLCCSPSRQDAPIWQSFLKGSQGYFTLRCRGCGKLTMRSCDIRNLQFESVYNEGLRTYMVKKGTERLICPVCSHEHTEADKEWCITHGEFVHLNSELLDERPSFQVGALASQLPSLSWSEIANAALEAGKTADLEIQKQFDNSIRGLPYKPRSVTRDEISSLKESHIWKTPPSLDTVEMVIVTSDTMDDFSSYGVWAWDVNDSIYLIEHGETPYIFLADEKRAELDILQRENGKPPVTTLEDIISKEYLVRDGVGIKPTFALIDQGGHKAEEVKYFVKMHSNVLMQKGTSMTQANWRFSDNQQRLVISNEKYWKSMAIYHLYSQKNKRENFLFLPPDISDEAVAQLRDVRPDPSSKWGDQPSNWVAKTGKDHLFDVLKYMLLARDVSLQCLFRERYRFGQSPMIVRRFANAQAEQEQEQQQDAEEKNWI